MCVFKDRCSGTDQKKHRQSCTMKICRVLVPVATVLLLSAVLCQVLSLPIANSDLDDEFNKWKITHEKVYVTAEEEAERRAIWEETHRRVEAHNKEADQGLHTYRQGLNQFSDRKPEERMGGCAFLPRAEPDPVRIDPVLNIDNSSLIVRAAETDMGPLLNATDSS